MTTNELIEKAMTMNSALFFSGGEDSLLLLYLVKDYQIPVITFAEDWSKDQVKQLEKIILDFNLTLYTFPPRERYLVPNGEGISLIDEYGFENNLIPVIRDLEQKESGCIGELSKRRFSNFTFGFDCILTGNLKEDEHNLIGNPMREIKVQDNLTFISPLWNWTKGEIKAEVERLGLKAIEATGELEICHKCLGSAPVFCHLENKEIPPVKWNPLENLSIFRERFGYTN